MKVLLADDDGVTRKLMEHSLRRSGYDVVSVSDGDQALVALQQEGSFRIALLDWMMPGHDGIELCRWIREQNREPYLYVVLVTSRDDSEDIVLGLDAGADDYVTKPLNLLELELRLRAASRMLKLQDELLRTRDALRHEAMHDAMTGLMNRKAATKVLDGELARALRNGSHLSLVVLDLDHFKRINDSLGHAAGDAVLMATAERLRGAVRGYDVVSRFGGEEFVFVLPECPANGAMAASERIRRIVADTPITYGRHMLPVTASIGVASTDQSRSASAAELFAAADSALYRAKRRGRNRVELATMDDWSADGIAMSEHSPGDRTSIPYAPDRLSVSH